ncbi:MAG: DUF2306 domain-containing protein, partial [Planctomycetia bacterium]|nr:DUF2306 domain-containing protein [Planctomycetia bacterium]
MNDRRSITLPRVLTFLAVVLVLKITGGVVLKYVDYFPPNFQSDFLLGREPYFFGTYRWAFYVHLLAGPVSLILGLILLSERFRHTFPKWHRLLGRIQVLDVLFLLAPSGLWMAYRAEAGPVAGVGFAVLAVTTGTTVALGWRSAVQRRFAVHRRWMTRCFLLLCSTVVLRLIAGVATVTGMQGTWVEPLAAWVSWVVPLAVFEAAGAVSRQIAIRPSQNSPTLSPAATEINARRTAAGN